jgi:uncharacterized membrane protein YfcA
LTVDSPWVYPLLFVTGLAAGWIDSIAGGGGLITIPVLLALGLPPQVVLGTNKLQASFGSFTAAAYYVKKDVVGLADAGPGIALTLVGACVGTWSVQQIDPGFLNVLIPVLLLAIALYMLLTPPVSDGERSPRMSRLWFYGIFGLLLGFYDGFFGPGVGSFWAVAFIAGLGFSLTKATGYTKVMNFTSNIVSCVLFLAGGFVLVFPALIMAAGQVIGARVGSGLVVKKGASLIRPIFIAVVILTTLKLLYNRFA